MKKQLFLIGFALIGLATIARAQKASEGRAVVSHGFENSDSIRFALLRPYDVGIWRGDDFHSVDTMIDPLGCNAVENFEACVDAGKIFFGHQKVICAMGDPINSTGNPIATAYGPNLVVFGHTIFQRIYTPLAVPNHHAFRYNDVLFDTMPGVKAQIYNNSYDSEDISPYVEYPANPAFVSQTFHTRRYNDTDSVVYYGNEGRVILGYSDDRNGSDMLTTPTEYPFPSGTAPWDTAKAFSVNLEFWLDTTNIDMTHAINPTDTDHVPLVRLQVLFKKPGQAVLPFVPFTNGSDANHGWFKCLDTVITRALYRNFNTDWRAPHSTFTGNTGHDAHYWVFKQFHSMITLNHTMDSVRQLSASSPTDGDGIPGDASSIFEHNFGGPSNNASVLDTTSTNPDSLVSYETDPKTNALPLIEIRVLSTYRTTVRVRDVTYQDTMVDRYLYRKRVGESTHSLEQNGAIGGNDYIPANFPPIVIQYASQVHGTFYDTLIFRDADDTNRILLSAPVEAQSP